MPNNTNLKIRVSAQILETGIPSWDVKVIDNTNNNALYVMEGALISTGMNDATRNLNASSGWGGNEYTSSRVAAPFAILDNIYKSIQKVLISDPNIVFPPLLVNWSINNVPSLEDNPLIGQIITSNYSNSNLYILGDANNDTDEYDDHVIAHEWGHYYEDKLSRSDSISGAHWTGDRLDIRVAFSEGFGNAFSAIVLNEAIYFDTFGENQANGFSFNMENEVKNTPGWYSEASIQRILYDLYDKSNDGLDHLSLGFTPLHKVFTGVQKTTPAFTSIFTFITALKVENSEYTDLIDDIVSSEAIAEITDIYGLGRTNLTSALPDYSDLIIGSTVNVCPSYTYGTFNKLGNHKYIQFSVTSAGIYSIRINRSIGTQNTDPDFILYKDAYITEGISDTLNSEVKNIYLNQGNYKLDVADYKNVVGACFDVTVNI